MRTTGQLITPSRTARKMLNELMPDHQLMMGPGLLIDQRSGDIRPRLIAWPLLPGQPRTDVTGRA